MKKKIIFIIPSFASGGAEKSLLTLLSRFDYEKYDVDLLAFNPDGMIKNMLPEQVNILDLPKNYIISKLPLHISILHFLKNGKPKLALNRFKYSQTLKKYKYSNIAEQYSWKYMKSFFCPLEKQYDAAIGYLEKTPNYFVADMVNAKIKLAYIHSDFFKLNTDKSFDEKYFNKVDYAVTVSQTCAQSLKNALPKISDKVRVIENIISKEYILNQASKEKGIEKSDGETVILTVGRISKEKGVDLAIEACKILSVDGYKKKWYHIGAGNERKELEEAVAGFGLQESFLFLGLKSNPYPFIKSCDIFVQPSRYEGKSIAVEEAKILSKPIVCTDFTTVRSQIEDGVTGFISEMNGADIARKIELLIDNPSLQREVTNNLSDYPGNEEEINKFYELIDPTSQRV